MWLEKTVTYQGSKYLVRCEILGEMPGEVVTLELYFPEDNMRFPRVWEQGSISQCGIYGKNLKEIVSNFVKNRIDKVQVKQDKIREFNEWDGDII